MKANFKKDYLMLI